MTSHRQLALGLFFIVALSILAFYTLFLTDFSLFAEDIHIRVQFRDASGLRKGDPVMVAGMRIGRVGSLSFDSSAEEDRRITSTLRLDESIDLWENCRIAIEDATLLGGKQVDIWPGRPVGTEVPRDYATPILGSVAPSPLEALSGLGRLLGENEEQLTSMLAGFATVMGQLGGTEGTLGQLINDPELAGKFAEAIADLGATLENANELTAGLRRGEGTLGKLFTETELFDSVSALVADLELIAETLASAEAQGTLPRLIHDAEWGVELETLLDNARDISEQITKGPGNAYQLLYDQELVRQLEEFAASLNSPEGTVGALVGSREFYDRWMDITKDIDLIASAVAEGDGTLGKLVMERELYEDLLISVRLLNRNLEDFREAAPITVFTSVLFSAF